MLASNRTSAIAHPGDEATGPSSFGRYSSGESRVPGSIGDGGVQPPVEPAKVQRVKGVRIETCNNNTLATPRSPGSSVAAGHRDTDLGTLRLDAAGQRQQPFSAPAKAYSRGVESEFQGERAKGPPGVDAAVGTVETTGASPQGCPDMPQTDALGRNVLKEGLEAEENYTDTGVAPSNVQRGPGSPLSVTETTKSDRKTRRTVEELRDWMTDERGPRLLSEESLMKEAEVETPLSPHDFGLHRWKEYAVLR